MTAPQWTERWFHAMGAEAHLQVFGGAPELGDIGADLEELEQCWSRFRPSSELSRLNADPRPTVEMSPLLAAALSRSRLAWELTDGRFDPTVHDTLTAAGYAQPFPSFPVPRGRLADCTPTAGMAEVHVDEHRCLIERPVGLRFDLGGIGKGLAADLLVTQLLERGAIGVCLALGGDVRVAGSAPPDGWTIPVEDPATGTADHPGTVWFEARLDDGAIVTCSSRFRRWMTTAGEAAHHLIDPGTGRPALTGIDAVVGAASEAWWAEVLAKAALVAGPDDGRRLLDRHDVVGWVVPS